METDGEGKFVLVSKLFLAVESTALQNESPVPRSRSRLPGVSLLFCGALEQLRDSSW